MKEGLGGKGRTNGAKCHKRRWGQPAVNRPPKNVGQGLRSYGEQKRARRATGEGGTGLFGSLKAHLSNKDPKKYGKLTTVQDRGRLQVADGVKRRGEGDSNAFTVKRRHRNPPKNQNTKQDRRKIDDWLNANRALKRPERPASIENTLK